MASLYLYNSNEKPLQPAREPIVSRPDIVWVRSIKADSTAIDSLKIEISKLQLKLSSANNKNKIIIDTVYVDRYLQYVSNEKIKLPYVRGEISSYSLTPVDSFSYEVNIDFNRWYRDRAIFGLQKETWYGIAAGVAVGVIGWELIRK